MEIWAYVHEPGYVLHTLEEAYLLADLLATDDLQRHMLLARCAAEDAPL